MIEQSPKGKNTVGLIPDFFHDILAYLVPGFTAIALIVVNVRIARNEMSLPEVDTSFTLFLFLTVSAYVIGRILEQLGYSLIHKRKFPFILKKYAIHSPKWKIINDSEDDSYSPQFKKHIKKKIYEWFDDKSWRAVVDECSRKNIATDDYFNIIQFYLRERFPLVALYEKKQNANIVLTRSLAILFAINICFYTAYVLMFIGYNDLGYSPHAVVWIFTNIVMSIIFYQRFKLDKKYHAMYIYETFLATKKLLKIKASKKPKTDENPTNDKASQQNS